MTAGFLAWVTGWGRSPCEEPEGGRKVIVQFETFGCEV